MAALIDAIGPYAPPRRAPTFAALVSAIVAQQISTRAAEAITSRLQALLGGALTPEALLAASDEDLRAAGLSRAKAIAVRQLAARAVSGDLAIEHLHQMDDEAIVAHLSRSRGIGRWTAEMFLIFALGREDVLPVGDLGLRTAIRRLYGGEIDLTPTGLMTLGERWRPYRSIATWYLWQSLRLPLER